MENTDSSANPVKTFWTAAAKQETDADGLRPTARDPHLQAAVEAAIERRLVGGRLLDVGCGDGLSTLRFAGRMDAAVGVDYIDDFVARARENAARASVADVQFEQADVTHLSAVRERHGAFDAATSIRCLINLTSWEAQARALREIAACLRPGGLLLMSEGWTEGFDGLNLRRERAGLPKIELAQYNLMMSRVRLEAEVRPALEVIGFEPLGMYLFISRVLMPRAVAPQRPIHNHPLNALAAELQSAMAGQADFPDCDYAGVYVLRKR